MDYNTVYFEEKLSDLGIHLSDQQIGQFLLFYELLVEKNKVMNLTAITDFDEVIEKHFIDSLSLVKVINLKEVDCVIDLGTGAGFPGIPLKIAFPELEMVLADSLNKRILFLEDVIKQLSLKHIYTIHGRAEDLAKKSELRETFDLCVSRAVANLSTLSEYCIPFVKVGGKFISYKSDNIDQEISDSDKAIKLLGGKIVNVEKFQIGNSGRSLIEISKIKVTSPKFPRKAGIPSKCPL